MGSELKAVRVKVLPQVGLASAYCFFFVLRLSFLSSSLWKVPATLMVLNKWAVVNKSAPPAAGLRPLARSVLSHPKLIPAAYKPPFVIRPFIKDYHVSALQHIENRGMRRSELLIERSRFPRQNRTLVVQTDGSLNEREVEFAIPPMVILFHDRLAAHRQRQLALAKIGQLSPRHSWELPVKQSSSEQDGEEGLAQHEDESDDEPPRLCCNVLEFPYCVPSRLRQRRRVEDPLSSKNATQKS